MKLKGIKQYKDRQGNWRIYHRKSGTPIDASLPIPKIIAEVERLNEAHSKPNEQKGTLGALLASYKASPRFTDLKPRTKTDYHKCMDYLKSIEGTPLHLIDTHFMAKLRDKTVKRKKGAFTNHMLATLSSAFKHGKEYGMIAANPCLELDKAKVTGKKPNRPWTAMERVQVLAAAPVQLRAPLALARFLGIRKGDILTLSRMAYKDEFLTFDTGKTGKKMKLPVAGQLKVILDAAPQGKKVTMLCVNSKGEPWTNMGFTASVRKFFAKCVKVGIADEGLTMHGLRHTVAAELKNAGFSLDQIKDYLGQETTEMASHYSSSADVSGVLIEMANVIERGPKRERVLSNSKRKSV